MESRFVDRLDPSHFADDEPVHLFIPNGPEYWVSERIWSRWVHLGNAYQLHLLPHLLAGPEPTYLTNVQAGALAEELEFLASVVNDAVVHNLAAQLVPILQSARRAETDRAFAVEGP